MLKALPASLRDHIQQLNTRRPEPVVLPAAEAAKYKGNPEDYLTHILSAAVDLDKKRPAAARLKAVVDRSPRLQTLICAANAITDTKTLAPEASLRTQFTTQRHKTSLRGNAEYKAAEPNTITSSKLGIKLSGDPSLTTDYSKDPIRGQQYGDYVRLKIGEDKNINWHELKRRRVAWIAETIHQFQKHKTRCVLANGFVHHTLPPNKHFLLSNGAAIERGDFENYFGADEENIPAAGRAWKDLGDGSRELVYNTYRVVSRKERSQPTSERQVDYYHLEIFNGAGHQLHTLQVQHICTPDFNPALLNQSQVAHLYDEVMKNRADPRYGIHIHCMGGEGRTGIFKLAIVKFYFQFYPDYAKSCFPEYTDFPTTGGPLQEWLWLKQHRRLIQTPEQLLDAEEIARQLCEIHIQRLQADYNKGKFCVHEKAADELRLATDLLTEDSHVRHLDLHGCTITGESWNNLFSAIAKNPKIAYLNLADCKIDAAALELLIKVLKENSSLKRLNLKGYSISGELWHNLFDAIAVKHQIEHLDLRGCEIDDAACASLARILRESTSLKKLNLKGCSLTRNGYQILLAALRHNSSLTHLNLANCNNIEFFAAELAQAFVHNPALNIHHLDLSNNCFTGEAAWYLAQIVPKIGAKGEGCLKLTANHFTPANRLLLTDAVAEARVKHRLLLEKPNVSFMQHVSGAFAGFWVAPVALLLALTQGGHRSYEQAGGKSSFAKLAMMLPTLIAFAFAVVPMMLYGSYLGARGGLEYAKNGVSRFMMQHPSGCEPPELPHPARTQEPESAVPNASSAAAIPVVVAEEVPTLVGAIASTSFPPPKDGVNSSAPLAVPVPTPSSTNAPTLV